MMPFLITIIIKNETKSNKIEILLVLERTVKYFFIYL